MTRPILRVPNRSRARSTARRRSPTCSRWSRSRASPVRGGRRRLVARALRAAGLTVEPRPGPIRDARRPRLARRGDAAHVPAARHRARRVVGRTQDRPVGPLSTSSCPATPRPGRSTRGRARDPRRRPVRSWRLRHEGRHRRHPSPRSARSSRPATSTVSTASWSSRSCRPRRTAARDAGRDPGGLRGDLAIITEPSNSTSWSPMPARSRSADRAGPGGPCAAASRGRVGARQAVRARPGARGDEARRNEAETDPLMTALGLPYPTIIGIVPAGVGSTVLDRASPTVATASGWASRPRTRRPSSGRRSTPPAPPTTSRAAPGDGRDHRRAVRVRAGAVRSSAAGRARRGHRGRDRLPSDAPRRALRRGHAAVRQCRLRHA